MREKNYQNCQSAPTLFPFLGLPVAAHSRNTLHKEATRLIYLNCQKAVGAFWYLTKKINGWLLVLAFISSHWIACFHQIFWFLLFPFIDWAFTMYLCFSWTGFLIFLETNVWQYFRNELFCLHRNVMSIYSIKGSKGIFW